MMPRRRGYMLLEVLVVMAVLTLSIALSVMVILAMVRTYSADAMSFQRAVGENQLADSFRADVAGAEAAPPRAGAFVASSRCLILRRPDRVLVVYQVAEGGLERIEVGGDEEQRRLLPLGSQRRRIAFERGDGDGLLTMRLIESRGLEEAPLEETLDITAALGGDLR